jgi:hypothetical protein
MNFISGLRLLMHMKNGTSRPICPIFSKNGVSTNNVINNLLDAKPLFYTRIQHRSLFVHTLDKWKEDVFSNF